MLVVIYLNSYFKQTFLTVSSIPWKIKGITASCPRHLKHWFPYWQWLVNKSDQKRGSTFTHSHIRTLDVWVLTDLQVGIVLWSSLSVQPPSVQQQPVRGMLHGDQCHSPERQDARECRCFVRHIILNDRRTKFPKTKSLFKISKPLMSYPDICVLCSWEFLGNRHMKFHLVVFVLWPDQVETLLYAHSH